MVVRVSSFLVPLEHVYVKYINNTMLHVFSVYLHLYLSPDLSKTVFLHAMFSVFFQFYIHYLCRERMGFRLDNFMHITKRNGKTTYMPNS